jgi:hypothetical protein
MKCPRCQHEILMKAASATRAGTTDLQSVLMAMARTAAQVCEANDALIILLVEGDTSPSTLAIDSLVQRA